MDVITLAAQPREVGKKGSRAARREGHVPCVLYGHHVDATPFQIPERSLHPLIYTDVTHLVKVELDSDAWDCILKDIAYHPVTDRPMHADFQVLQAGERVTISVPVRYVGTSIGQSKGGRTTYVVNELEVTCLPKDIPSQIDVDVTEIDMGDAIYLKDLDYEELDFSAPADQILMTVLRPRVEEVEETDELDVEGELEDEDAETDE